MKPDRLTLAKELFSDLGVQVCTTGRRYLGGAIGSSDFVRSYLSMCVAKWVDEIERLSSLAESQPHAAFAVFTHGLSSTWTFVQRVLEADDYLFAPMAEIIRQRLLPALRGPSALDDDATRDLRALPARFGALEFVTLCQLRHMSTARHARSRPL